jgi:phosphotransferase system HPr (HPr) family protein
MAKVVKKIEIKNKLGLHARAAALLVQTVNRFSAQVTHGRRTARAPTHAASWAC